MPGVTPTAGGGMPTGNGVAPTVGNTGGRIPGIIAVKY